VRDEVEHQGDSGAAGLGARRCRDAEGVTGATATAAAGPSIERVTASAYTVPTDRPESDGTLEWDATTIVVVEVGAADETGIGWTYGAAARNLDGLRLLRNRAPAGMDVAAGEYASSLDEFRRLAGTVDCLQADATRCGGITGLLAAGAVAEAHELDLSGHTGPTIHAHALAAVPRLRHLEWFHDHVRVERLLFDGVLEPVGGVLRPDPGRPGLGVELKSVDAERYAA
jgi:hypothetical protein